MKTLLIASLALVACGENYRSMTMAVTQKPSRVDGVDSRLAVPDRCPVYTPTGGDIDTPEPPFPDDILFQCAVDASGAAYGTETGDTGDLAILPGGREIGVYLAFKPELPPDLDHLDLDTDHPVFRAFVAAVNVDNHGGGGCCAEDHPEGRVPLRVVASGPSGILLTAGTFDDRAVQIEMDADNDRLFPGYTPDVLWNQRIYVNAPPTLCLWEDEHGTCHDHY